MKCFSHINGELSFGAVLLQDGWVGGEFNKGKMSISVLLFLKSDALTPALTVLALKLVNLVSPCMSLAFFELTSLFWSLEQVAL